MTEGADRLERPGGAAGRVDEAVRAYIDGKSTIQLRPEDAAGIADDEFRDLARAALEA